MDSAPPSARPYASHHSPSRPAAPESLPKGIQQTPDNSTEVKKSSIRLVFNDRSVSPEPSPSSNTTRLTSSRAAGKAKIVEHQAASGASAEDEDADDFLGYHTHGTPARSPISPVDDGFVDTPTFGASREATPSTIPPDYRYTYNSRPARRGSLQSADPAIGAFNVGLSPVIESEDKITRSSIHGRTESNTRRQIASYSDKPLPETPAASPGYSVFPRPDPRQPLARPRAYSGAISQPIAPLDTSPEGSIPLQPLRAYVPTRDAPSPPQRRGSNLRWSDDTYVQSVASPLGGTGSDSRRTSISSSSSTRQAPWPASDTSYMMWDSDEELPLHRKVANKLRRPSAVSSRPSTVGSSAGVPAGPRGVTPVVADKKAWWEKLLLCGACAKSEDA